MKTLISGGASLLGKYLVKSNPDAVSTYNVFAPGPMWWMDVTDEARVDLVFSQVKPNCVIHCAAVGDVDGDPEKSRKVNVGGTENIVKACRKHNCKMVYISTNAVFDGENAPYKESDIRNPINEYGKIKAEAENKAVECLDWIIIRPILLYGNPYFMNSRDNFVTRVIKTLKEGKVFKAVNDTLTQPTYVGDLADAIWYILRGNQRVMENPPSNYRITSINYSREIFHIAPDYACSLYSLAMMTAEVWELDNSLIESVPSDYFDIEPRPKNTTYDLTKITRLGIECSNPLVGLTKMREENE